jgi:hypothetical protein
MNAEPVARTSAERRSAAQSPARRPSGCGARAGRLPVRALEAQLQDAVRFVVLPVLIVTGIAMWQAPRIRRLRKGVARARAFDSPQSPSPAGRER